MKTSTMQNNFILALITFFSTASALPQPQGTIGLDSIASAGRVVGETSSTCHESDPKFKGPVLDKKACEAAIHKASTYRLSADGQWRQIFAAETQAFSDDANKCTVALGLDAAPGTDADDTYDLVGTFKSADAWKDASVINKNCKKGGKKYLPTERAPGQGGWYVEVKEYEKPKQQ